MRNVFGTVLFLLLLTGCSPKVEPADIARLNGYWEIEKVTLPDGEKKEYTINQSFDYFELKGNKGFRKKVMPQLDGTFQTNDLTESVSVTFENDKTWLHYSTRYAKWKEELRSLTDSVMVVVNAEKKEYQYKKTAPINLLGDGKKTQ